MLEKFYLEIKGKRGAENLTAYHLSRLERPSFEKQEEKHTTYAFLEEHLYSIHRMEDDEVPWFANFANYLVWKVLPKNLNY